MIKRLSKNNKIACVIYYSDLRYKKLAQCAYDSFNYFHSDIVDTYLISPENMHHYPDFHQSYELYQSPGWAKFFFAYKIANHFGYEKIITLGSDTITCARLNDFIENDDSDCIATLGGYIPTGFMIMDTTQKNAWLPASPPKPVTKSPWPNRPLFQKSGSDIIKPGYFGLLYDRKNNTFIDITELEYEDIFGRMVNAASLMNKHPDRIKSLPYIIDNFESITLNADVTCFNNVTLLENILAVGKKCSDASTRLYDGLRADQYINLLHEQGILNFMFQVLFIFGNKPKSRSLFYEKDFHLPELESDCYYNNRSTITKKAEWSKKQYDLEYIQNYYVENGCLYTEDKKQIKVFHYCQGLGNQDCNQFERIINKWREEIFNNETKIFFKQHGCGDFFEEPYKI